MSGTRLDTLTAEQQALLPKLRDEWIAHGLSCAAANRELAVEGVNAAYRTAGLAPPRIVVWLDSPLAGTYGAHMVQQLLKNAAKADQVGDQVGDQVRDQVWDQVRDQVGAQVRAQVGDQVRDQVWAQVRDQVGDQVRDQVGAQVRDQVGDQVRDQVWAQVRDQVGAQVRDQVWAQVRAQVGDQVRDQVGAQVRAQVGAQVGDQVRDQVNNSINSYWDIGWLSFYAAFRELGLEVCDKLAGLIQVAQNAGWWFPFHGAVVLCARPTAIHLDNQGRLHCETGPAVSYPDGFAVYSWHGTRVPADLVTTGWDMGRILSEGNAEIRRCAVERLGTDEFERHLTVVAEAPDPGNAPYTLRLADLPRELRNMYDADARILLCTNGSVERDGTRRRFALPVPGHHTDPVAAAAEMYDMPVEAYRALQVRR